MYIVNLILLSFCVSTINCLNTYNVFNCGNQHMNKFLTPTKFRNTKLNALQEINNKEEYQSSNSKESSFGDLLIDFVMKSPLYTPIVNVARNTMVKSATTAGIDWEGLASKLLAEQNWTSAVESVISENPTLHTTKTPSYYKDRFHGYADGNLCIKAAIEQGIAGKAVGARNFPQEGINGEEVLRGCYDREIIALGGCIGITDTKMTGETSTILDLGCGTGTSTRRLAKLFPHATRVIGVDLSPYMIAVGRYLQLGKINDWWLETIEINNNNNEEKKKKQNKNKEKEEEDNNKNQQFPSISYVYNDIGDLSFIESNSIDFVSLSLVLHEIPQAPTLQILTEIYRVLKPGKGILAIMEMDPQAPGYQKLIKNKLLFSILRSTEPYLDDYFNLIAPKLPLILNQKIGFPIVKISAATGRHFCIVAQKGGIQDLRPSDDIREKNDQHVVTPFKMKNN